ncbi:MAG: hypothetical protein A2487_04255 [Candidatus Raymondbacteria bacterium RifOxyC12_full_50_8]|uniref:Right handed beta helix domain-containing protein n=1 Tax=Candidatus Raymondbacteria bacterium RIFOXYD12_FULL_49_13 TaxID=1817890 RepID=A0A1F7F6X9_UNCRA|nr:MAG: hypothetical protein A2248_00200 [Candidatus Raymondbacteria bacterium RIFOXYA2_FULL_49_16]OGJ96165.1 MAG: hypothetical protein A2453_05550 [Candidatus Raymondbacteria bacterium RIFOXYC2_FULL_50_21]OGK02420.1 MAG: hypothetical protein A2519_14475 [Candidatus Raymondbacteria bacterium RIFOXYD12_FULL_49_13]OGK07571.1 MAG: hypothetical protein A2487_04255 [Candidatus Raymondbacteria bacterium RifOxyC12_full_50_8]OGP41282.1 MAG: hypothetical protein A2324_16810 [Candidatus Raymondbacteria b
MHISRLNDEKGNAVGRKHASVWCSPVLIVLFAVWAVIPASASWPPDTCDCIKWKTELIDSNPDFSGNQVVYVSRTGQVPGTISSFVMMGRLRNSQYNNTTYIVKADTQPYIFYCNIYTVEVSNVLVRGETGRREDVVFVGNDPRINPTYWHTSEYGGTSPCGAAAFFQFYNASHFAIADLTLRNIPGKMFKMDGGSDIIIHNVDLWDCGSQFIKAASSGSVSARDVVLECSKVHYTTSLFSGNNYTAQGMSIHKGRNWTIRGNWFENIRDFDNASHAVLMWDNTDTVYVYNNLFVNNNFNIEFGLDGTGNHMYAWNNVIVYNDRSFSGNVGIGVRTNMTSYVYHNTIYTTNQSYTVAECPSAVPNQNNLYNNGDGGNGSTANNIKVQNSAWQNPAGWDFRLTSSNNVPRLNQVLLDIRGKERPDPTSAGAFEYGEFECDLNDIIEHGADATPNDVMDLAIRPNPANALIGIQYTFPVNPGKGDINIYSIGGLLVHHFHRNDARGTVLWNGDTMPGVPVASGVYIVKAICGERALMSHIIFVK